MKTSFPKEALRNGIIMTPPQTKEDWEKLAITDRFDLASMAKRYGKSVRQLRRDSVKALHLSPSAWMSPLRMRYAATLLTQNARTKEIAYLLGFKNPSDFCHAFRLAHKVSPKTFLRQIPRPEERMSAKDNQCPLIHIFGHCPLSAGAENGRHENPPR